MTETANKYYLGKICCNGHDFLNTGRSQRYISSNRCVECTREHNKKYSGSKGIKFPRNPKSVAVRDPNHISIKEQIRRGLI